MWTPFGLPLFDTCKKAVLWVDTLEEAEAVEFAADCDENTPECLQCLRSGKECPGPLQGTLFLIATEKSTKSTIRDTRPSTRRPRRIDTSSQTHPEGNTSRQGKIDGQPPRRIQLPDSEDILMVCRNSNQSPQSRLPSLYQPSRASAFQELFLDHFINAFFDPCCEQHQPSQWSSAFPIYLSVQKPQNSIVHAIRAATMAHYSKINGDIAIQMNSMRWYAASLESYQVENAATQQKLVGGGDIGNIFTEIVVLTPIMLMFFESVMGTIPSAWAQHLEAASSMLEIIGPWRCRRGILHQIFKIVRIGAVYMGVTWKKRTSFASEEWSMVPYLEVEKTASDHLNDILLQIPECLDISQQLRQRNAQASLLPLLIQDLEDKTQRIIERLREYWKEYGSQVDPEYTWKQYREETNFQTTSSAWKMVATPPVRYRDKIAAKIISDFDAGNVIVYSVLLNLDPDFTNNYKRCISVHCASILEAVAYLEKLGVGSGGHTFSIFPLKTVNLCSPSRQQVINSALQLERWGKSRGVEGACEIWREHHSEEHEKGRVPQS